MHRQKKIGGKKSKAKLCDVLRRKEGMCILHYTKTIQHMLLKPHI